MRTGLIFHKYQRHRKTFTGLDAIIKYFRFYICIFNYSAHGTHTAGTGTGALLYVPFVEAMPKLVLAVKRANYLHYGG